MRGLLAESARTSEFRLIGEMLSYETYGIMIPRDKPALADTVERRMRSLAESREMVWIYNQWFVQPLPSGPRLDLPMSAQLRRFL